MLAFLLTRLRQPEFPEPIGVFRAVDRPVYDVRLNEQIEPELDAADLGHGLHLLKQRRIVNQQLGGGPKLAQPIHSYGFTDVAKRHESRAVL